MPEATISPASLRIIKLLVGRPPQTIANLIRMTGVTRTAVAEQLNELAAAGMVAWETQRLPGRGRPRRLYKVTDAALVGLFPGNQRLVVPAILRAIMEIGGDEMFDNVISRVGRIIGEHYAAQITARKPQERLRQLVALLAAEGEIIEAAEESPQHVVIKRRSCPFISMVDERRGVCHIDQEMLGAVAGCPIRRTACRREGDDCCCFEIAEEKRD